MSVYRHIQKLITPISMSVSTDLPRRLGNAFEYVEPAGTAQFSSLHLLRSSRGDHVAHVLSPETTSLLRGKDIFATLMSGESGNLSHDFPAIEQSGFLEESHRHLYWLTSPLPKGSQTAQHLMSSKGQCTAREVADIGREMCRILTALHARDRVHGGITIASVLLHEGRVTLLEIGVEYALRLSGLDTSQLPIALKAHYLAPEQLARKPADERADIYSTGAVLYELLTGKAPFGGRTTTMVMASVLTDAGSATTDTGGREPEKVVSAILRAIETDPADRWSSASQFGLALLEASRSDHSTTSPERRGCMLSATLISMGSIYGACRLFG